MLKRFASVLPAAATLALAFPAAADEYQYDSLGRLIRVTYDNGAVVQYSYDAAGNRTTVVANLNLNRPPVANNDSASVAASAAVDILVRANDSDPDGDSLAVTAVGTPSGGGAVAIQGGGTHVRYTAPATGGAKTFTYTISDGRGGTASASVTVNVTASNSPPVAVNDTYEVEVYTTAYLDVLANDSDPNGNPLTITSVSGAGASIASGGGYLIYAAGGLGTRTLQYTVSDGAGGSATASVQVLMYRIFPDGAAARAYEENEDAQVAGELSAAETSTSGEKASEEQ
jgi:YD repeat-containing protein